jgi:hypothetical protein
MRPRGLDNSWRVGLIIAGLFLIISGVFLVLIFFTPDETVEDLPLIVPRTPTPIALATPIQALPSTLTPASVADLDIPTATPTASPTSTSAPNVTPTLPPDGIIYALSPDINSVGWVQDNERGNHFGESHLYTGVREGVQYHGAVQFDLSFIQDGSTIFSTELELTGLNSAGLTNDSSFQVNILAAEIDEGWSRHGFTAIRDAEIAESLTPILEAADLATGRVNKFVFNAAQRSLVEEGLERDSISFRLDSLFPEGWFSWDSGYGDETQGMGPILRLGVLPPPATEAAAKPPPGSTPTPTPTFIIITSTPTPQNILTAAAIAPILTVQATTTGTPTPLPENWVTPFVVTSTPTPENTATAAYQQLEATAIVLVLGPSTPIPQNQVTATPTPTATATPIFILLEGELPPASPTPPSFLTPEPTPTIPVELIGKIAFKSDRTGQEEIYVINPDGSGLALLTHPWPYLVAQLADTFSSDGRFRVFTKQAIRYRNIDVEEEGIKKTVGVRNDAPAIYWYDSLYQVEEQLTRFGQGLAWSGVWSPASEEIAFVSNDSGDDEIWVVNRDGSNMRRVTETNEAFNAREIGKNSFMAELNGHPSWSPDGTYLTFWSNRTGHGQIWVMDSQGNNLYSLSRTDFNDWDPIWIKYPGIPGNAQLVHMPYLGPYDPWGTLRNCGDFRTQTEAQLFYIAAGGPARDLHRLDENLNGLACDH